MMGHSNEMTEVVLCQERMSGKFVYIEGPVRFYVDNIDVILSTN